MSLLFNDVTAYATLIGDVFVYTVDGGSANYYERLTSGILYLLRISPSSPWTKIGCLA
jgi:hypothetical protein